jgi:hypothetical protein
MPNAMSTVGQGGAVFLTMPACSINAGANTDVSGIEFDFKPIGGNAAGFFNIAGVAGNNTTAIRIEVATGTLQWRQSGTVYLSSAAGVAPMGERAKYGAEWEESTLSLYLTKNGDRIAGPYVAPSSGSLTTNISWAQIGRVGTSSPSPQTFELYGVRTYGANATYQTQWDDIGATGDGVNWADDTGTRNITISGHTGAANSWWFFYSSFYVGEGTISVSAAATADLASTKVGNATVSAVAAAVAAVQGSKIGSVPLSLPISAGIILSASKVSAASFSIPINAVLGIAANKVGITPLYVEAVADISLYAGNIYIGEGTFTVSASAAITLQGGKVGASPVQFGAAAAVYCNASKLSSGELALTASASASLQSSKLGHSTLQVPAVIASSLTADKTGISSIAVLASATITIAGSNQAAVPTPVTLVFVRSSSRQTHNMRTSSRYNYNLITSSGGARV